MSMTVFDSLYVTNALQMTVFTSALPYGAQSYQPTSYGGSGIYDNSYYNNNTMTYGGVQAGGAFDPMAMITGGVQTGGAFNPMAMITGGAQPFGAFDPMAMTAGGAQTGGLDVMSLFFLDGLGNADGSSGSYSMLDYIRDVFNPILGIDKIEEKANNAYSNANKAKKTAKKAEEKATKAEETAKKAEETAKKAEETATNAEKTAEEAKTTTENAEEKSTETENKIDETIDQLKTNGLKGLGISEDEATKLLGISVVDADGKLLSDDQIAEKIKEVLGPSDTQIDSALGVLKLDKAAVQKEALTDAGLTGFRTGIMAVKIKNGDGTMRTDDEIKNDLRNNVTHAGDGRTKLTDTQIESALAVLKYEDADVEAARNQKLLDLGLSEDYAKTLQAVSLTDGKGNARPDADIKDQMKRNFDIPYEVESIIDTLKLGTTEA